MNIVLVVIDTLRYDHVGVNTPEAVHTPNLDRFAAGAWNFHRAFAASYPTIPQRTDLTTGRWGAPFHPWRPLRSDVPTLPRLLAGEGYCSQLIHDTPHLVNGGCSFDCPFDAWLPVRGAEVDRAWITDSWEPLPNWREDPLFDGTGLTTEEAIRRSHALVPYVQTNRDRKEEEDWNVAQLFSTAARFLRANRTRERFFLWLDCFDPHEPWDAPPEFVKLHDATPGYDGTIDPRAFHPGRVAKLSDAARARLAAMYRAKVSFMDKWLGRFLDALEETGLDRSTAVVITADHGTNVGDRDDCGFGKAAPPMENEAHVPLLVRVPGRGAGESHEIVQPQDVFATVLGLAGVASPAGVTDGRDVLASGGEAGRELALTGPVIHGWPSLGAEKVLFSAFDREWHLAFTADPAHCRLRRLGSREDVAAGTPERVASMHAAAVDEMERRGLDPSLVAWLRSEGRSDFPAEHRVTDAPEPPAGWHAAYWRHINKALGR
ncbi:MAG: sulfatase [Planctomycetota bacterium]|jgi:arylsulfatase A-like enzyme